MYMFNVIILIWVLTLFDLITNVHSPLSLHPYYFSLSSHLSSNSPCHVFLLHFNISVIFILPSPHFVMFSQAVSSCQSSFYVSSRTPYSSPIPFSSPPTPCYTPCCTPRRLSLSLSLAESSTNLRDSTKTTSTSLGLVRLLLEHGISASVYNPCSWDRGLNTSEISIPMGAAQVQRGSDAPGEADERRPQKRPANLLRHPTNPPNSPPSKSASSTTTRPVFQLSLSTDDPPYYETFLASKPARTILREVLGEAEILNLHLVDKLKGFRTLSPLSTSTGLGNSALGRGLPGLRRNRSYPAMVGASMAMKDPGGPPTTEILTSHTMQTPNVQNTEVAKIQRKSTLVKKAIHIPQTLHALETVTPQTIIQRYTRPNDRLNEPDSQS